MDLLCEDSCPIINLLSLLIQMFLVLSALIYLQYSSSFILLTCIFLISNGAAKW